MLIQLFIAALLLVNACLYVNKLFCAKRYRLNQTEQQELKVSNVGYLLISLICMCLTFFI